MPYRCRCRCSRLACRLDLLSEEVDVLLSRFPFLKLFQLPLPLQPARSFVVVAVMAGSPRDLLSSQFFGVRKTELCCDLAVEHIPKDRCLRILVPVTILFQPHRVNPESFDTALAQSPRSVKVYRKIGGYCEVEKVA